MRLSLNAPRLRRPVLLALLSVLTILVAACSRAPEPTTTTAALSTTTTLPATTTTVRVPPTAPGFDWVPAASGECETDVAAIEEVMADHPRAEVETGEHFTAFSQLLTVILHNCRRDYIERWNIEVYLPWTTGVAVTPGRVPHDFSRWPAEWLPQNQGTTTTVSPGNPADAATTTTPEG